MSKYFKPKSVAWWSGIGLLIHGAIDSYNTKSISPQLLEGLAAVGLRGAIGA